jgi:trk system potassium uptake protein TrkH
MRLALGVAVATMLARRADASSVLPLGIVLVSQFVPIFLCVARLRGDSRDARTSAGVGEIVVLAGVAVACLALVYRASAWSFALSGPVLYVLGLEAGGYLGRLYQTVENLVDEPRQVLRIFLRPWAGLIVCGTVALALPIATRSGVPDYGHNFWLHVVTCGFTASSAAALVGNSIYSLSEDFTRFGQGITILIIELAGLGFAAVALCLVRPYLTRVCRLGTVYRCLFASQAVALVMLCAVWPRGDAANMADRVWTSLFYCVGAAFNAGFTLKPGGLAHVISTPLVFVGITTLAVLGSIGWPFVLDLLQWGGNKGEKDRRGGLAEFDIVAALVLLVGTAFLLLIFETPGSLPTNIVPTRPVDFGERIVSIRDQMPLGQRWSLAVFISATLRSSGLQSIPLSPGGISIPSYFLMLMMMLIGGSMAGTAGGLRTTTVTLPVMTLVRRKIFGAGPEEVSRNIPMLRMLLFVPVWICGNVAAILALRGVADGTWYEIALEATAAWNGVGLSSGLSLHLTAVGRLVMMLTFVVGRLGPILYWLHVCQAPPAARTQSRIPG